MLDSIQSASAYPRLSVRPRAAAIDGAAAVTQGLPRARPMGGGDRVSFSPKGASKSLDNVERIVQQHLDEAFGISKPGADVEAVEHFSQGRGRRLLQQGSVLLCDPPKVGTVGC